MGESVGERKDGGSGVAGGQGAGGLFGPSVDCTEAVHELYRYLDGELTEERRTEIRVHLEWCAPCHGAADFEAELRRVIASRCQERVPEGLIQRVAQAIEREAVERKGAGREGGRDGEH